MAYEVRLKNEKHNGIKIEFYRNKIQYSRGAPYIVRAIWGIHHTIRTAEGETKEEAFARAKKKIDKER